MDNLIWAAVWEGVGWRFFMSSSQTIQTTGTSCLLTKNVYLFKLKKCDPWCVDLMLTMLTCPESAETFQSGCDQIRLHPPYPPPLPPAQPSPAQPSPALLCVSCTGSCFRGFNLQISILVLDTGHWTLVAGLGWLLLWCTTGGLKSPWCGHVVVRWGSN